MDKDTRISAARTALHEHGREKNNGDPAECSTAEALIDLLADLKHLAKREHISFRACLNMADIHCEMEK